MKITILKSESAITKPKKRSFKGTINENKSGDTELSFIEVNSVGEKLHARITRKKSARGQYSIVTAYSKDGKRYTKVTSARNLLSIFENGVTLNSAEETLRKSIGKEDDRPLNKFIGNLKVSKASVAVDHERIFDLVNTFKSNKVINKTEFKNLFNPDGTSDLFRNVAEIKSFVSGTDKIAEGKKPTAKQLEVITNVVTRKATGEIKKSQTALKKKISNFIKIETPRKPKNRMLDGPDSNRGVRRKPTAPATSTRVRKPKTHNLYIKLSKNSRSGIEKGKITVTGNSSSSVEVIIANGKVECIYTGMSATSGYAAKKREPMHLLAAVRKLFRVNHLKLPAGLESAIKDVAPKGTLAPLRRFDNAVLESTK